MRGCWPRTRCAPTACRPTSSTATCGYAMRNEARTERCFQLIADWPERYGVPPSYRELAVELDCQVSTVHWHVSNLVRQGRVTWSPGKNRTLRVASPERGEA